MGKYYNPKKWRYKYRKLKRLHHRRPLLQSVECNEQIVLIQSIYLVLYRQERQRYDGQVRGNWMGAKPFMRREIPPSKNRHTKNIAFMHLWEAEKSARLLNERYNTDRFIVRKVFMTAEPRPDQWSILFAHYVKNRKKRKKKFPYRMGAYVKRMRAEARRKRYRKARLYRARLKYRAKRKIEKAEARRNHVRHPLEHYRRIDDYAPLPPHLFGNHVKEGSRFYEKGQGNNKGTIRKRHRVSGISKVDKSPPLPEK